jgi:diguanylate cyclase
MAAAAALLITGYCSGLLGPFGPGLFLLILAMTTVATIWGVRTFQPRVRWPYLLCVCSFVVLLVGAGSRVALGTLGDLSADRSLLPDLITFPGYLIGLTGLAGFVRARGTGRAFDLDAFLDGAIAATTALMVAWVYLIVPAMGQQSVPLGVRLVVAAYPPVSVFMVTMAARIAFVGGLRPTIAQRLVLGSLACALVGDVLYAMLDAGLIVIPHTVVDLPYAVAFTGWSLAVTHPSMRSLTEPVLTHERAPRRGRLCFIALSLALPPIVALAQSPRPGRQYIAIVAMVVVVTALSTLRIYRALRDHAASQARLLHQATHDALTGLPNRLLVNERLDHLIANAALRHRPPGVIFLDVDRFKLVNDTKGHTTGDKLLVAVAERLCTNIRPGDIVGRIGGDEFIVIVDAVGDLPFVTGLAERIHRSFEAPFEIDGQRIYTSASIGVAVAQQSEHHLSAETLIRDADTAMYEAKEAGRDGVAVFDASMRDRVAERLTLEQELRVAVISGQLHVHYQPIVRLPGGRIEGLEALLRWTHPQRGLVSPMKFIPIAEDVGLIGEIGMWVINEACRNVAAWRRLPGAEHVYVAVNVSARQLRDRSLVECVMTVLARHGLPGDALCLEITESMLISDPEMAAETLHALRALDVRLSVDDFGTGFSSLSYLKRFPVNNVKIDRSFVDGMDVADSSEESLVAAIIAMASALRMTTIAEGVETEGQAARLAELHCDRAQGFLYSRPLPPNVVPRTIAQLSGRPGDAVEVRAGRP